MAEAFQSDAFQGDAFEVEGGTSASAEHASGSGAASQASAAVSPSAGIASGSGTAFDATVSTSQSVSANAEVASGTGEAFGPTPSVGANAGHAGGTGQAHDATVSIGGAVNVDAEHASGTGSAFDATVTQGANVSAGHASGTGSAFNATVDVDNTEPHAGHASGTGQAYDAAISISAPPTTLPDEVFSIKPHYHGQARIIHVEPENVVQEFEPELVTSIKPQMTGRSKAIRVDNRSIVNWHDEEVVPNYFVKPAFHGRSKAIHVHGEVVIGTGITPPDPVPSCDCCSELGGGGGSYTPCDPLSSGVFAVFDTFARSSTNGWLNSWTGTGTSRWVDGASAHLDTVVGEILGTGKSVAWALPFVCEVDYDLSSPESHSSEYGVVEIQINSATYAAFEAVVWDQQNLVHHSRLRTQTLAFDSGAGVYQGQYDSGPSLAGTSGTIRFIADLSGVTVIVGANEYYQPWQNDLTFIPPNTYDKPEIVLTPSTNATVIAFTSAYGTDWTVHEIRIKNQTNQGTWCSEPCVDYNYFGLKSHTFTGGNHDPVSSYQWSRTGSGAGTWNQGAFIGGLRDERHFPLTAPDQRTIQYTSWTIPGGRLRRLHVVAYATPLTGDSNPTTHQIDWSLKHGNWGTGAPTLGEGTTILSGSIPAGTPTSQYVVVDEEIDFPYEGTYLQLVLEMTSPTSGPAVNLGTFFSGPSTFAIYATLGDDSDCDCSDFGDQVSAVDTFASRDAETRIIKRMRDSTGISFLVNTLTASNNWARVGGHSDTRVDGTPDAAGNDQEDRVYITHNAPAGATYARLGVQFEAFLNLGAVGSGWTGTPAPIGYKVWQGTWGASVPAWDDIGTVLAEGSVQNLDGGGQVWAPDAPREYVYIPVVGGRVQFVIGISDEQATVVGHNGTPPPANIARYPSTPDGYGYANQLFFAPLHNTGSSRGYELTFFDGDPLGTTDCCEGCPECDDYVLLPFTPDYLPIFRPQFGDPTTTLDSLLCNMESGAMALDWQTRGSIQLWGGELIPFTGRSEASIQAGGGTNLNDLYRAWQHFGQYLSIRSGQTWAQVQQCLNEGRAVVLHGDYDQIPAVNSCQAGFEDNHAIILLPVRVGTKILVGDPLCSTWHPWEAVHLQNYAEDYGVQIFGVTSPQKVVFAVSGPWAVAGGSGSGGVVAGPGGTPPTAPPPTGDFGAGNATGGVSSGCTVTVPA